MFKISRKFLIICGIIAPLIFTLEIIIIGIFHPNYNHITQYISELGAINAPFAIFYNILLSISGILILIFSFGLFKELDDKFIIKILGSVFIAISGLSFFLIGFFPCDPDCINITIIGLIHGNLANAAQIPLLIAPLLLSNSFKFDKSNFIKYYSIFTTILGIVFFIIYKSYIFEGYTGLFQRISFGIPLLWIEIIAIKMFRNR
jgi:hypothetical membrane protein